MPARFIVYELCHPDGTPFYVGKGNRVTRPRDHLSAARRGATAVNTETIRLIEDRGESVIERIVFETSIEEEAFAEEVRRIAEYRARGVELTNRTRGGHGAAGRVITKETRERMRLAQLGKTLSLEHRRKLSKSHKGQVPWAKGRSMPESTRQKLREANLGKRASPETRAKISAKLKGRVVSPETREKLRASMTGKKLTEEQRRKIWETRRANESA